MDLFDAADCDFLMSRRTRRRIALALMVGIFVVPAVRSWYIGQIERHAEHVTREIQDLLIPELSAALPVPAENRSLSP